MEILEDPKKESANSIDVLATDDHFLAFCVECRTEASFDKKMCNN